MIHRRHPLAHPGGLSVSLAVLLAVVWAVHALAASTPQQSTAPHAAASSDFELARKVEFNGGAIVDAVAADAGSLLIVAGMPAGFSIFRLSGETGRSEKFVSAGYLAGLLGAKAAPQDWTLRFDPATQLLVLLPRREGRLLVLDVSSAPRLRRYRLGLPAQFRPGDVAFIPGGGMVLYPRPFLTGAGRAELIVFKRADSSGGFSLTPVQIDRLLSTILQLHAVDSRRAVALGYFRADGSVASPMLAVVGLADGHVELWEGTGGARLLSGAEAALGVVRRRRAEVIPADRPGAAYELALLDAQGDLIAGTQVVPIFTEPRSLTVSSDGRYALILMDRESGFPDLWLVNTHTRAKRLVRTEVMLAGMMPNSAAFYAVPAQENAVYFYRLAPAGTPASE